MPQRDGTGPQGLGPRTGRGAGYCADGTIRSNNIGRGWRNMFRLTGLPGWMRFGQMLSSPIPGGANPQLANDMGCGQRRHLNQRARRRGNW